MSALLEAFGTNEEELALNRQGALSDRQRAEVRKATGEDAGFMIGFAIVLALVIYAILVVLVRDGRFFGKGEIPAQVVVVLFTGVLPTTALVWAARTAVVHKRTVLRCEHVEGSVTCRVQQVRTLALHEIRVGDRSFGVNERAHALIVDGARYRVHFVPKANVVVSIESSPSDQSGGGL